jgi:glycosyltransferase 2 family protein
MWFGFAVMAVMFFLLLRDIDWQDLWSAFTRFHILWIIPSLAIYLTGYLIRGFRWVVLLSPVKKCRFQSLFPTLIIGFMANNLLPARAGEFVRAYLNGTKEKISRSTSLATILLERIFDGLTMIIMLGAALSFGNLPVHFENIPPDIQKAIHACPYVFGIAFLFLFFLLLFKNLAVSLINFLTGHAPAHMRKPLNKMAHTFFDGLKILKSAKESFLVLATSFAAWTCEFSSYYLLGLGMGIAPLPISFWSTALLMAVVNIAILIPNAPGGFGLFEYAGVKILVPFGLSKELSLGYMLIVHLVVWVPINLLGLYFMSRDHLSLGKLEKSREKTASRKGRRK